MEEDLGDILELEVIATSEPIAADPQLDIESLKHLKTEPYNSEKALDEARRKLAYLLAWLLAVICCFTLFVVSIGADFDHMKGVLELVIGPVSSLVGAATGFYFGSKSK